MLKIELTIHSEAECARVEEACTKMECTPKQLTEQAIAEFLDNHGN